MIVTPVLQDSIDRENIAKMIASGIGLACGYQEVWGKGIA
jgi:hypothetical protein